MKLRTAATKVRLFALSTTLAALVLGGCALSGDSQPPTLLQRNLNNAAKGIDTLRESVRDLATDIPIVEPVTAPLETVLGGVALLLTALSGGLGAVAKKKANQAKKASEEAEVATRALKATTTGYEQAKESGDVSPEAIAAINTAMKIAQESAGARNYVRSLLQSTEKPLGGLN